ncbi:hypothetical protein ROHU_027385 [Labeo rohita]|uniref:Uncharacterized protein n=1 Tax=Labeo rohita TaxID=84645 RepID=A0A498M7K3_LABRO|nr:hypothetical protein ROHU_031253 [Labeo rohita]RXN16908.1 hypothetical protein ROHU_027385 [Labeo rohita]
MTSERGKHAPPTSIKQPDTNKRSHVRKKWTRQEKIIWPVAPDGYIPNSVVRSLAPYPQFNHFCANRGLQIKEQIQEDAISAEQKLLLKYFLEKYCPSKEEQQNKEDDEITLKHDIQSVPEETNITASLTSLPNKSEDTKRLTPLKRAVPQSQNLLQNRSPQQNAPSLDLQMTDSSLEDLKMKDSSVDELQMKDSSVEELKNEEDGEKDQSLCEKSDAFSPKQPKKVKKGQKISFKPAVAVSPRLQEEKVELHQDMVSSIKEQKRTDSTNKSVHVLEIGTSKQTMRQKAKSPLKKLKSFVSPLSLMGDRRPNSVLIYLYKRSKAESAHEGVKRAPKVA